MTYVFTDERCIAHADFPKKNMKAKVLQREGQPENSDRLTLLTHPQIGLLAAGSEFQDQSQCIEIQHKSSQAKIVDVLKIHDNHYIQKVHKHIDKLTCTDNK